MVGLGAREASVQIHHLLFLVANSLTLLSFLSSPETHGLEMPTLCGCWEDAASHLVPSRAYPPLHPTSSLGQCSALGRPLRLPAVIPPGSPQALGK